MTSSAGRFPYRSGIHEGMYRVRPWTIRQYSGFGSPSDTNLRFRELIESGVTGLSIAFDLPTQMGLDPDDERAIDEVGRVGVSVFCLQDMRDLFHEISLEEISVSMTINATAPILLLMYQIVAEENRIDLHKLRGTIQNDILKEFISRSTYVFPPEFSLKFFAQTFRHCVNHLPNWNPISISGYHMAEAGATATQELAFTFSNALEYTRWLLKFNVPLNSILEKYTFFFASRLSLLQEVAKFRAAREIWAKLVESEFPGASEKSKKLRFHVQTAGSELHRESPELNIIRVTIQAIAAIFGGAQSIHTNSFDEAVSLPSLYGAKIATATQHILQKETNLTSFIDPFEGSIEIERETERLIEAAKDEISRIETMGGALGCILQEYQKGEIANESYSQALLIDSESAPYIKLDETWLRSTSEVQPIIQHDNNRITGFRESRKNQIVMQKTRNLSACVSQSGDIIPLIKECLLADATLGEIVSAIRNGLQNDRGFTDES